VFVLFRSSFRRSNVAAEPRRASHDTTERGNPAGRASGPPGVGSSGKLAGVFESTGTHTCHGADTRPDETPRGGAAPMPSTNRSNYYGRINGAPTFRAP